MFRVLQLFEWPAAGVPLQEFRDDFRITPRAAAGLLLDAGEMLSDHHESEYLKQDEPESAKSKKTLSQRSLSRNGNITQETHDD